MRKIILIFYFASFLSNVSGQENKIFPNNVIVDSLISIDGMNFREFLGLNVKYPVDAVIDNTIGTYIGCIRIDMEGNLINVFTINPIKESVDKHFVKLIFGNWSKAVVNVNLINDTTDIFVPILYTFLDGPWQEQIWFHIDYDMKPEYVSKEITVAAFSSGASTRVGVRISFDDDYDLINNANENYMQKKYKRCIRPLNELIRRNPYNGNLIFMRAMAYLKLEKNELASKDYWYLKEFLKYDKYKRIEICD